MGRLGTNRIALVTALVGLALMILTIVWRINPVEGSVVPDFLTVSPVGRGVFWTLAVTCMPVWIFSVYLADVLPMVNPYSTSGWVVMCCMMCIIQFILYFGLGRLGSRILAVVRR